MINIFLIITGKILSLLSRLLNLGSGSTWPGHIALNINKNFIKDLLKDSKVKIILIAGTNGKTTTGKLIQTILNANGKRVFQNESGANLLNGIASSIILNSNLLGKIDKVFAIFEIDENTLPLILKEINNPDYLLILNLFRDQLDRYGEVNIIAKKWKDAMRHLPSKTTLLLNSDDPQVANLASHLKGANVKYFGMDPKNKTEKAQHASDSTYCPNCGKKLIYNSVYFSHLGDWECKSCNFKHPKKTFTKSPTYPLQGAYNQYNTNAAVLFAKINNISNLTIQQSLRNFKPAFGRQEVLNVDGKKVQIFLSKNPTSFNESLRTIASLNAPARNASQSDAGGKNLLIVLNDKIPDGLDVSWIWDVDFEEMDQRGSVSVSGDRVYDMALRLKYAGMSMKDEQIYTDLKKAISENLSTLNKSETLYILPTYSAMLEVRKILTGRKIL